MITAPEPYPQVVPELADHLQRNKRTPMISFPTSAYLLFVGAGPPLYSTVLHRLEDLGCETRFATSFSEALLILKRQRGAIVFSEMYLPDGSARTLVPQVTSSCSSLFVSLPVEDGCWWIPIVLNGEICLGEPALRSREFTNVLLENVSRQATADKVVSRHVYEHKSQTTTANEARLGSAL